MKLLHLLGLAGSLAVANGDRISYDGYKVVRVGAQRDLSVSKIQEQIQATITHVDEWERSDTEITVNLSPSQLAALESLGLSYETMHEDLGRSIAYESRNTPQRRGENEKRQAVDDPSWFESYHAWEDHKTWFEDLHAAYPNNSELVSTGTSYQGRDQFGIHFWGSAGPGVQPAVLWHGTVHAREWISAMVVEYLTLQLLSGYGSNQEVTGFVNSYDFYVFPFVNPDGFVHTQTTDRLWRKNRQPAPCSTNSTCIGRDVNRNWPWMWDANPNGASTDPCSQTYKGAAPADSPEMKGMHSFVDTLRDTQGIKLFIDWHSYSQYLLAPVGYNCTHYVPTLGQHIVMGREVARSIYRVDGVQFVFGPSCAVLYPSTGYSVDYAYEVGGAQWAYLIELRDQGQYGFVLPPELILISAQEQWAGMRTMLRLVDQPFWED
ncbi:zinc carboxypeptidase [Stachybotrys elegans]|uniref:Zinc carboxypeptidase n=1 Tax=Stachybotrys elegans TaxID=80388 RepID=A0A8K0SKC1_9HYPO|nr:zinc carboxypeptidase [Stachybotrys elegans]